MADETTGTPTAPPAPPQAEPDPGILHGLATSIGIDPEAVKSAAKAIWSNPVEAARTIGGAQMDEFVDAAQHPVKTARLALNGVISSITNPEAQATAKARFNTPGFQNKIHGVGEYITSGIPLVGGGYAKAEEQGAQGHVGEALGTIAGTTLPMLAGEAEGIPEKVTDTIHEAGAKARENMAAKADVAAKNQEARIAEAKTGKVITIQPDNRTLAAAPDPDKFAAQGGKLVGPNAPETAQAAAPTEWQPPANIEKGIPSDKPVDTQIPLEKLSVSPNAYSRASSDISRGRGSKTNEPIRVLYNPDNGQYLIEDGMHRVVEAHQKGETSIPAKLWSGYSDTTANVHGEKMDLSPEQPEADPVEDLIMSDKIGGKKVKGATPKVEPTVLAQRAPEAPKGLVERTTGDEQADAAIKSAGAIPAGTSLGMALFHDPKTGSTLAFKPGTKITPEAVQAHLAESRQAFGIKPEPEAFVAQGGKFVGDQPAVADKATTAIANLYMDSDENAHPFTYSYSAPFTNKTAPSLILPDGRITNARLSHSELAQAAGFKPKAESSTAHIDDMLDSTGAARIIYPEGGRGNIGVQIHQPPTPDQLQIVAHNLKKAKNAGIGDGSLAWDLKNSEGKMISGAGSVGDFRRAVDTAYPDQQDIVSKELRTPFKETYGMEITDREGKTRKVPIDAHSSKQALALLVKKFPDASEWRLDAMPEEKTPSTEYAVPSGKIQKMKVSGNRTELHTIRHELGHAMVGLNEGNKLKGMVSSSHPVAPNDMRAGVLWDGTGLWERGANGNVQIREDKRAGVVRQMMGGIAADELLNDIPRAANHNFPINAGGDGTQAYSILTKAGFTHEEAMEEMHKMIDDDVAYLSQPHVSAVIKENEATREKGLSTQFHYSPERLQNMHAEAQRRIANEKATGTGVNDNRTTGAGAAETGGADVARGEGGISPADKGFAPEGEEGIVSEEKVKKTPTDVKLRDAANKLNAEHGRGPINPAAIEEDPRSSDVADSYKAAVHAPNDPAVKASYDALKRDVVEQFALAKKMGIKMDVSDENPYGLSGDKPAHEELHDDVLNNKHLTVWSGGAPPADHPLSEVDPKTGFTYNEMFRMVHDIFGHAVEKNDFSPAGEESAWNLHRQMFSPEARPALATETKGQAAYTYKYGDFPPQKAAILPAEHQVRPEDLKSVTPELAKKIVDLHKANGGSTYNLTHGDMAGTDNYAVSTHPDRTVTLDHPPTAKDIQTFAAKNQDLLQNPDKSLGTWHNKDNDTHVLDVISTLKNKTKAVVLGKKNNQIAIFHLGTNTEIPTGGTGITPLEPSTGGTPDAPAAPPMPKESAKLPIISSRIPSKTVKGETIEEHTNGALTSDMQAAAAAPGFLQKLADRVAPTPGFKNPGGDATAQTNAYIRHTADNIKFVQGKLTPEEIARDSQWYPVGAHERGIEVAKQHKVTPHQAYAVTAALSPLTDWDVNTSLAERAINIWQNQQNTKFTPEMKAAGQEIASIPAMKKFAKIYKSLEGKTLGELKNVSDQAHWLRLYDEGHNPREYQTWNPDGTSNGLAKNMDGSPKQVSWSFQNLIQNAIHILKDGSQENISKVLGGAHKVRNFYNNQLAPNDPRFLTIDTHAVAVGQLRPMSGKTYEVRMNFGGTSNKAYGLKGTYSLHDAAYRLAAKELDIPIPSRLQSSTWTKIREVFPNRFKTAENQAAVDAIWKEHTDGKITADEARDKIWSYAEGWNGRTTGEVRDSGDQRELFDAGVQRESAGGAAGRGDRGNAPEESSTPLEEGDTDFNFGANAKPVEARSRTNRTSATQRAKNDAMARGIAALINSGKKK